MGKSSSGRSKEESEVSSRSERRRTMDDAESSSTRTRSYAESPTSGSTPRRRSSRKDDRDRDRDGDEHTPTSKRYSTTSQEPYTPSNVAPSYVTAPTSNTSGARGSNAEMEYKQSPHDDRKERSRYTSRDETSRSVVNEGGDDQSYDSSRRSDRSQRRDSKRQSVSSTKSGRESSRALDNHDAALPQNQFPGQAPDQFTAPYRPPGLAAEYYNDHGESVAQQPGIRPQGPSIIETPQQAHLYMPSTSAAPPPEPSSVGQVGAAASYFDIGADGADSVTQATPSKTSRPGRLSSSSKVSGSKTSPAPPGRIPSSGPGPGALGAVAAGIATGAAAEYFAGANSHTTSSYSQQNVNSSSNYQNTSHQNSYSQPGYGPSGQQPRPGVSGSSSYNTAQNNDYGQDMYGSSNAPRPDNNKPHYGTAVAAAGLAGAAAAGYYAHNQHEHQQGQQAGFGSTPNSNFVLGQNQSAFPGMQQQKKRRQRRGPINSFVNWFRDPEGVAQFEQYTEAIGVCKYCFDPNSTAADAPRRHHYHKHESNGPSRRNTGSRVNKSYRNSASSSSDEGGRKRVSAASKIVAGGLVGYGATKVGEALYNQKNDFDDTYSVKSGQPVPAGHDQYEAGKTSSHMQSVDMTSRDRRNSRIEQSSYNENTRVHHQESGSGRRSRKDDDAYIDRKYSSTRRVSSPPTSNLSRGAALSLGTVAGAGAAELIERKATGHRSRSSSRERTNGIRRKRSYYSKRISPRHSYVDLSTKNTGPLGFGNFFSSPSANERKGKKKKGFFNLQNDSSSSSDADLAFGEGTVRRKTNKDRKRRDSGSGLGGTAAILGLAATGAALAAESDRRKEKDNRGSRRITNDAYTDPRTERQSATKINLHDHETTTDVGDEGVWEDASDDDMSSNGSIDTALAYGGRLSARTSRESLAEQGTSKWAWRWNKTKDRKSSERRQSDSQFRLQEQGTYDIVSAGMAAAGAGAAAGALESYDISPAQTTPLPPMQWVDPMPTTSPGLQENRKISNLDNGPSPHTYVSRSPAPLKQPQALTGPNVSDMPQVLNKLEADAQLTDSPQEILEVSNHRVISRETDDRPRPRRNSSPPLINPSSTSRNSVSWKLTDEQIENERKAFDKEERRRRRREEKARRSSTGATPKDLQQDVQVETAPLARTESLDKRAAREAEIDKELKALYAEHERQMEEQKMLEDYRRAHGEVGGIGAAIVGAGVGAAAAAMITESKKSSESDSDRRSRRKSSLKKSSVDRVEQIEQPPSAPSPPRRSSPPEESQQERISHVTARRNESNASPVHEDYATYFIPQELAENVKEHNEASESRMDAQPKIITIDPDSMPDPRERPFSPDKYQPFGTSRKHDLDYHPRGVPRLELVPATPPGGRPPSRMREPSPLRMDESAAEEHKEKPRDPPEERRMSNGSKVNWGSNSTHVFDVETPEQERRDPIVEAAKDRMAQVSGSAEDIVGQGVTATSYHPDTQIIPPVEEMTAAQQEHLSRGRDLKDLPSAESATRDTDLGGTKSVPVTSRDNDELLGGMTSYQSPFAETVSDLGDSGKYQNRSRPQLEHDVVDSLPQSEHNEQRPSKPAEDDRTYHIPGEMQPSDNGDPVEKPRSTRSERRRLERALSSSENVKPIIKTIEPDSEPISEEAEFDTDNPAVSGASHPSMPGDFVFDYLVDEEGQRMSTEENRKLEIAVASALSKRSTSNTSPNDKKGPTIANTSMKRDVSNESPEAFAKPTRASTFDSTPVEYSQSRSRTDYASDPEDWETSADKRSKRSNKPSSKSDVGLDSKVAFAAAAAGAAVVAAAATAHEPSYNSKARSASQPDFHDSHRDGSQIPTSEPDFYALPTKKSKKSKSDKEAPYDFDTSSVTSTPVTKDEDRKSKRRSKRDSGVYDDDDDNKSVVSLPTMRDEDKKSKRKSKRDSEVFDDDDTRSVTSTSTEKRRSKDKEKEKKSSGLFANIFSSNKSDVSSSSKKSSKSSKSESRADRDLDASSDKERRRKRRSKGVDDDDESMSIASEPVERSSRNKKSPKDQDDEKPVVRESRDTSVDDGFVSADEGKRNGHHSYDNNVEESFLAMGPEMPQPTVMDIPMGTDGVSGLVTERQASPDASHREDTDISKALVSGTDDHELPPLPVQDMEEEAELNAAEDITALSNTTPKVSRTRDLSTLLTGEHGSSPAASVSSPTAVPLRFGRRFPVTPGSEPRIATSPGLVSPLTTPRTRQSRPKSTEFSSGKDFKPLYLLERHNAAKTPAVEEEETLPSLPSSRTSSAHPSMEDLRGQSQADGQEYFGPEATSPESHSRGRRYSHDDDFLDSRSATPVPGERQRARESEAEIRERKDKLLKYAFHSPSELLQDPAVTQDVETEIIDDPKLGSPLASVVSTEHDEDFMSAESRVASPEQDREVMGMTGDFRPSRSRSPSRERPRRELATAAVLGFSGAAIAAGLMAHGRAENQQDESAPKQVFEPEPLQLVENSTSVTTSREIFDPVADTWQNDDDKSYQSPSTKQSKKEKKKKNRRSTVDFSEPTMSGKAEIALDEDVLESTSLSNDPPAITKHTSQSGPMESESSREAEDTPSQEIWDLPTKKSKKSKKKKGQAQAIDLPEIDTTAANEKSTAYMEAEPSTAIPVLHQPDSFSSKSPSLRDIAAASAATSLLIGQGKTQDGVGESSREPVNQARSVDDHPEALRPRSDSFVPTLADVNTPGNNLSAFEEAFERAVRARGLSVGATREDAIDTFLPKRNNAPFVPKTDLTPVPEGTPATVASPPNEDKSQEREAEDDMSFAFKPSKKSKGDKKKGKKKSAAPDFETFEQDRSQNLLAEKEGINIYSSETNENALAGKNPFGNDFEIDKIPFEAPSPTQATKDVNPFGNDFEIKDDQNTTSYNAPENFGESTERNLDLSKDDIEPNLDSSDFAWTSTSQKDKKSKKKKNRKNDTTSAETSSAALPEVARELTDSTPESSNEIEIQQDIVEQLPVTSRDELNPVDENNSERDLNLNEDTQDLSWTPPTKKDKKKNKKSTLSSVAWPESEKDLNEQTPEELTITAPRVVPSEAPTAVEDGWAESSGKKGKKSKKDKKRQSTSDWTEDVIAPAAIVAGTAVAGAALASVLGREKNESEKHQTDVPSEPSAQASNVIDLTSTERGAISPADSSDDTKPDYKAREEDVDADKSIENDLTTFSSKKAKKDKKRKSKLSSSFDIDETSPTDMLIPSVEDQESSAGKEATTGLDSAQKISKDVSPEQKRSLSNLTDTDMPQNIEAEPARDFPSAEASAGADDEWAITPVSKKSKKDKKKKRQSVTFDIDEPDAVLDKSVLDQEQKAIGPVDMQSNVVKPEESPRNRTAAIERDPEHGSSKHQEVQEASLPDSQSVEAGKGLENSRSLDIDAKDPDIIQDLPETSEFTQQSSSVSRDLPLEDATGVGREQAPPKEDKTPASRPFLGPPPTPNMFGGATVSDAIKMSLGQTTAALAKASAKGGKKTKSVGTSSGWQTWSPSASFAGSQIPEPVKATVSNKPQDRAPVEESAKDIAPDGQIPTISSREQNEEAIDTNLPKVDSTEQTETQGGDDEWALPSSSKKAKKNKKGRKSVSSIPDADRAKPDEDINQDRKLPADEANAITSQPEIATKSLQTGQTGGELARMEGQTSSGRNFPAEDPELTDPSMQRSAIPESSGERGLLHDSEALDSSASVKDLESIDSANSARNALPETVLEPSFTPAHDVTPRQLDEESPAVATEAAETVEDEWALSTKKSKKDKKKKRVSDPSTPAVETDTVLDSEGETDLAEKADSMAIDDEKVAEAVEPVEDEWSLPTKKSKKDKKKKRISEPSTPAAEAYEALSRENIMESNVVEETGSMAIVDAKEAEVAMPYLNPVEGVEQDLPRAVPAEQPEAEEWAFATMSSKKDKKKKRKSQVSTPIESFEPVLDKKAVPENQGDTEPASSSTRGVGDSVTDKNEDPQKLELFDSKPLELNASDRNVPDKVEDEDWYEPVQESKKEKRKSKKNRSDLYADELTPKPADDIEPTTYFVGKDASSAGFPEAETQLSKEADDKFEDSQEQRGPDTDATDQQATNPIQDEDFWDVPKKASKKDKKKKRQSGISTPTEIAQSSVPIAVRNVELVPDSVEDTGEVHQPSSDHGHLDDSVANNAEDVSERQDINLEPVSSKASDDEWAVPSRKASKTDKKQKRKSKTVMSFDDPTPVMMVEDFRDKTQSDLVENESVIPRQIQASSENQQEGDRPRLDVSESRDLPTEVPTVSTEDPEPIADEDWGVIRKTSKKDKKKSKKNQRSLNLTEMGSEAETPTPKSESEYIPSAGAAEGSRDLVQEDHVEQTETHSARELDTQAEHQAWLDRAHEAAQSFPISHEHTIAVERKAEYKDIKEEPASSPRDVEPDLHAQSVGAESDKDHITSVQNLLHETSDHRASASDVHVSTLPQSEFQEVEQSPAEVLQRENVFDKSTSLAPHGSEEPHPSRSEHITGGRTVEESLLPRSEPRDVEVWDEDEAPQVAKGEPLDEVVSDFLDDKPKDKDDDTSWMKGNKKGKGKKGKKGSGSSNTSISETSKSVEDPISTTIGDEHLNTGSNQYESSAIVDHSDFTPEFQTPGSVPATPAETPIGESEPFSWTSALKKGKKDKKKRKSVAWSDADTSTPATPVNEKGEMSFTPEEAVVEMSSEKELPPVSESRFFEEPEVAVESRDAPRDIDSVRDASSVQPMSSVEEATIQDENNKLTELSTTDLPTPTTEKDEFSWAPTLSKKKSKKDKKKHGSVAEPFDVTPVESEGVNNDTSSRAIDELPTATQIVGEVIEPSNEKGPADEKDWGFSAQKSKKDKKKRKSSAIVDLDEPAVKHVELERDVSIPTVLQPKDETLEDFNHGFSATPDRDQHLMLVEEAAETTESQPQHITSLDQSTDFETYSREIAEGSAHASTQFQAATEDGDKRSVENDQILASSNIAEEDEWALPGKKSKKDKKKKSRSIAEDVPMDTGSLATAAALTAAGVGTAALMYGSKPEHKDNKVRAEDGDSTNYSTGNKDFDTPMQSAPDEELAFETKKSKKDKKKKRQSVAEQESFEPSREVDNSFIEPRDQPISLQPKTEFPMSNFDVDDTMEWSKDDGRRSQSIDDRKIPDRFAEIIPEPIATTDVSETMIRPSHEPETELREAEERIEPVKEPDDMWQSGSSKKSKKGKEKSRNSAGEQDQISEYMETFEDVDRVFVAPPVTADAPIVMAEVNTEHRSRLSAYEEERYMHNERSGDAYPQNPYDSRTMEEAQTPKEDRIMSTRGIEDSQMAGIKSFEQPLVEDDEWATTGGKVKKGKKNKKRQSTTEASSKIPEVSRDVMMDDDFTQDEDLARTITSEQARTPAEDSSAKPPGDEWAIPVKKSKKDKKNRKSAMAETEQFNDQPEILEPARDETLEYPERRAGSEERYEPALPAAQVHSARELHEAPVHQDWLARAHAVADAFPTKLETSSEAPAYNDLVTPEPSSQSTVNAAGTSRELGAEGPEEEQVVSRKKSKKNKKEGQGKRAINIEDDAPRISESAPSRDLSSAYQDLMATSHIDTQHHTSHEEFTMQPTERSADLSDTGSNISESTRERRRRRRSPPLRLGDDPEDLPRDRALTPPPDHDDIMDTALGIAAGLGLGATQMEHSREVPEHITSPSSDSRGRSGWSFANIKPDQKGAAQDLNRDSGFHSDTHETQHANISATRDSGYVPSPSTDHAWNDTAYTEHATENSRRPIRPRSPTSSNEALDTTRRSHASVGGGAHSSETSRGLHKSSSGRQPSPVSPTSKERSSVLFQSSPAGSTPSKTPRSGTKTHLDTQAAHESSSSLQRTPSVHGHQHKSREELRQESTSPSARRLSNELSSSLMHRATATEVDRAAFSPSPRHSTERHISPSRKSLQPIPEGSSPLGGIIGAAALGGVAAVALQQSSSSPRDDPTSRSRSLGKSKSRTGSLRNLRDNAASPFDSAHSEAGPSRAPAHGQVSIHGAARDREMAEQFDGYGSYPGSPMSPTRPPSVRKRQSMQQIRDLEAKVDQLANENRSLAEAKIIAERHLEEFNIQQSRGGPEAQETLKSANSQLQERDREIVKLRAEIASLISTHENLRGEHENRFSALHDQHTQVHSQWQESSRELEGLRSQHAELSSGMEDIVRHEIDSALAQKNIELQRLRSELDAAREQIKELQAQILARGADEIVIVRDEDYFDNACQQLCQLVQQWVLRFSKFSDTRVCRGTNEVRDEKIVDRFDNAILDGSDVDIYLADRVKRRDVFMSVVMTMIWEYVFTRYLFGMDRGQRQKLKQLEQNLSEVGPPNAVHQWRALTLTLLSRREAFKQQCESDTEAVVLEIMKTLSKFLPPPQNLEQQVHESLRKVMQAAVDLSIEMRTQKAEYIMLPPLQPEYDTNGDLARKVFFNASLMNERSGETISNDEVENSRAVVRIVLFPLVVKKGDDGGHGDEEIVVCPAQVLVARPDKGKRPKSRLASGGSVDAKSLRAASTHSLAMSGVDMTSPGGGNMI